MKALLPRILRGLRRIPLLFLVLFSSTRLSAQGQVNVNNRGLNPPQLVVTQAGIPLTGTQFVAQIVYGPDPNSLTNKLGDPMPFRATTTTSPGTWNPGANGIRTLVGFVEGQNVFMQVFAWNSALFSRLEEARDGFDIWTCRISGPYFGGSGVFSYRVGSTSEPSSQILVNFRSFTLLDSQIWPGAYIVDELGGRWLRVVETTEDIPSVTVDLRAIPSRPWYPSWRHNPSNSRRRPQATNRSERRFAGSPRAIRCRSRVPPPRDRCRSSSSRVPRNRSRLIPGSRPRRRRWFPWKVPSVKRPSA